MDSVLIIKIISSLLYPVGLIFVLGLVGLVFHFMAWDGFSKFSWVAAIIVFLVASNPLFAQRLVERLERQHPQIKIDELAKHDAIVVLGGGLRIPLPPTEYAQIGAGSERYWHAVRLFKAGKADKIILSGGNVYQQEGVQGEAYYASALLQQWGVPSDAIIVEQSSRTTQQNRQNTEAFLKQYNISSILLVTSAIHMPRSYQIFSSLPVEVTAASSDILALQQSKPWILNYLPTASALAMTTNALHEYYGIGFNKLSFNN